MKFFSLLFAIPLIIACTRIESRPSNLNENMTTAASFYDFKMKSIDGMEIDFSQFKGKKILIVNTASKCGYTPQYEDLEKLHKQYGKNVVLINATVGPNVSLGDGCHVQNSTIKNSLIQTHSHIKNANLDNAMIGNHASFDGNFTNISIGDYSVLE